MEIALFILFAAIIFIIKALKVVPQQNSNGYCSDEQQSTNGNNEAFHPGFIAHIFSSLFVIGIFRHN